MKGELIPMPLAVGLQGHKLGVIVTLRELETKHIGLGFHSPIHSLIHSFSHLFDHQGAR